MEAMKDEREACGLPAMKRVEGSDTPNEQPSAHQVQIRFSIAQCNLDADCKAVHAGRIRPGSPRRTAARRLHRANLLFQNQHQCVLTIGGEKQGSLLQ